MSDVRIEIEPNNDSLLTFEVEDDLVPHIEALGLSVDGPEPAIEQRSAETELVKEVLVIISLTAGAVVAVDKVAEIALKWLRQLRPSKQKQIVKLLGPKKEVLAEIERDDD